MGRLISNDPSNLDDGQKGKESSSWYPGSLHFLALGFAIFNV